MIASHELSFGSRIIFKRLYVVLCNFTRYVLWNFSLSLCDCNGHGHCYFLSFRSRLSSMLYRLLCLAAFAVFVSPYRCRRLRCKNYSAFSLNKHDASPQSRNCDAIHAFIESVIRPFVIDSYYSKILKSCHALVIVHLEVGVLYDK